MKFDKLYEDIINEDKALTNELTEFLKNYLPEKTFDDVVKKAVKKYSKNAKFNSSGWSNFNRFSDGDIGGQYRVSMELTDRGSNDVTPAGEFHEKETMPMIFQISILTFKSKDPVAFNMSANVAGGMKVYNSTSLTSDSISKNKSIVEYNIKKVLQK
jgi:hypothetical protein